MSEKRVGLTRSPPLELWALNWSGPVSGAPVRRGERLVGATRRVGAAARKTGKACIRRFAASPGARGPTRPRHSHPIWRALRFGAAGTPVPGHDVSATGRQILGGAMQSITTMMPVWHRASIDIHQRDLRGQHQRWGHLRQIGGGCFPLTMLATHVPFGSEPSVPRRTPTLAQGSPG